MDSSSRARSEGRVLAVGACVEGYIEGSNRGRMPKGGDRGRWLRGRSLLGRMGTGCFRGGQLCEVDLRRFSIVSKGRVRSGMSGEEPQSRLIISGLMGLVVSVAAGVSGGVELDIVRGSGFLISSFTREFLCGQVFGSGPSLVSVFLFEVTVYCLTILQG